MGLHESQSLLWERMVALSKPFMPYLLPKILVSYPPRAPPRFLAGSQLFTASCCEKPVFCHCLPCPLGVSTPVLSPNPAMPAVHQESIPSLTGDDASEDLLYIKLNEIMEPSLIRVESDEVIDAQFT